MEQSIVQWLLAVIGSGGLGAAITYISTFNHKRKLMQNELAQAETATEQQQGQLERDRFETMYNQITEMTEDYNELSDSFRKYRQESLQVEQDFIKRVQDNLAELATLKAKINYLKQVSCYNYDCPHRIKVNPEKAQ